MSDATKTNEPYDHDPEIAECDKELEDIESKRLALKERGRKVMAKKARLMMIEQLTLRRLAGGSFSPPEMDWIETNPDEWEKIKAAVPKDKVGSRRAQTTKVI